MELINKSTKYITISSVIHKIEEGSKLDLVVVYLYIILI